MTQPLRKLLILCSGGDAPGMNAAIRSVVRSAIHQGIEVFGCERGFAGLAEQQIFPLTPSSVANIIQRGGTILKTARFPEFENAEIQAQCKTFLLKAGIDSLIVLGGNGSFQGARKLAQGNHLKVIGIPCTIDCDIVGTEYCIGFDTACNTAVQAIDKIRDTALSHDRNFIIEVMGKRSGFLAVHVGLSVGAELILIPEQPQTIQQICSGIQHKRKKLASIIIAAEADDPGHSFQLAKNIQKHCHSEYKVCVLGHIQRGGSPSSKDRIMGTHMGSHAITALLEGQSNQMVTTNNQTLMTADFPEPNQATRFFDNEAMLNVNQIICHE